MEITKYLHSLVQSRGVKDVSNDRRLRFRSLVVVWENGCNSGPPSEKSTKKKPYQKKITLPWLLAPLIACQLPSAPGILFRRTIGDATCLSSLLVGYPWSSLPCAASLEPLIVRRVGASLAVTRCHRRLQLARAPNSLSAVGVVAKTRPLPSSSIVFPELPRSLVQPPAGERPSWWCLGRFRLPP